MYICKTNTGRRIVETVFTKFIIEQKFDSCMYGIKNLLYIYIYRSVNRETLWMIRTSPTYSLQQSTAQ